MHRARHLAAPSFTAAADRILFTTYTANLAENVEESLAHLCGPEKDRIEVVHLHAWAVRFLRDQGVDRDIAGPDEIEHVLGGGDPVIGRTGVRPGFLRQEWEQVVLANGIEDRAAYLKVPRLGRGKTLSAYFPHISTVVSPKFFGP